MDKTGGEREEKSKAKAGLGPRLSKGVWTWPEIKVSGYRWDTKHPKAVGGYLAASNRKQEKKKPQVGVPRADRASRFGCGKLDTKLEKRGGEVS